MGYYSPGKEIRIYTKRGQYNWFLFEYAISVDINNPYIIIGGEEQTEAGVSSAVKEINVLSNIERRTAIVSVFSKRGRK